MNRQLLSVQMCLCTGPTVPSAIGDASKFNDLLCTQFQFVHVE